MFSIGSLYIEGSSAFALRGNVDIEGEWGNESGSFTIYINGADSLFFLLEGPFNVDLFRMVIADGIANIKSRESKGWSAFDSNENIEIPEYGIENITPSLLAVYILPQYFLEIQNRLASRVKLESRLDDSVFEAITAGDGGTVALVSDRYGASASYRNPRSFENGYYPSEIKIFDDGENWLISMEILKIRKDPEIPRKTWYLSP
jgi:hypothetical protein